MLENAKVGDRVRSVLAGRGTITDNYHPGPFPIRVRFDCGEISVFMRDGRALSWHEHPEIIELTPKQEWEPEGGVYCLDGTGKVIAIGSEKYPYRYYKDEGRAYPTEELAKKAHEMIRSFQRLVAYVLEHAPDYEPDWGDYLEEKWYVKYDNWAKKYVAEYNEIFQHLCQVYMPKEVAIDLAEKLNSGEVEL